jgi:HD superfamily phosphodiesterase
MKTIQVLNLLNHAFNYVIQTSKMYNIDESHSLKHSMEVYKFAKNIYNYELVKNPHLSKYEEIIYVSAIGHDMCDKKYMDEITGINNYKEYLNKYMNSNDLDIIGDIIGKMSYSKVKKYGYPNLGESQLAYHIVREADLLAAYDFERCIIYKMYKDNVEYISAIKEAKELFDNRMFKMIDDNLFVTDYSKQISLLLHEKAKIDVEFLTEILKNY